jgi:putative transposase
MIAHLHQEHAAASIRHLCRLAQVSRSWFYDRPSTPDHPARDVALRDAIEELVLAFPGYGYRRVTHALARDGWTVNHKRVLRVMRDEALLCQLSRQFVVTTDSQHRWRRYPNLLKDLVIDRLDTVWVADITYIRLPTTFVYLAAILDACSRRCIGWELSRCIDTRLTRAALERALAVRDPAPGLIHHSDQGVQYASQEYVARLEEVGARVSMAAAGNPYENAQAERFWRTLKHEEIYLQEGYATYEEARRNIGHFIDDVYNTKRLHSALGYRPPAEFEAGYARLK